MHHEVCADKQKCQRHHERRSGIGISLLWLALAWACTASAGQDANFRANITLQKGYRFQGIDQMQGKTGVHGSAQYQLAENFSAGIWAGEYELPGGYGNATEIDYFVGYSKQISFDRRIETSLWRYTLSDEGLDDYDWSQWLTSFHIDERFTLTAGVSDNFLFSEEVSTFLEGTMRKNLGHWTLSLSVGRNNLSATPRESFEYMEARVIYGTRNWHVFADYTVPSSIDDPFTAAYVSEGAGFGISYILGH